jgi:hypothetical protein
MVDFKKLREYTDKHNSEILKMSNLYNVDEKYLKRLCQEIGFQTQYTYSDAIILVNDDLGNGLNINQIIIKYGLDEELI